MLFGENQGRDLFKTLCNPQLELSNISLFDDTVMTEFKYKNVYATECANTNIFVGVTTTAEARVLLYEQMSKLDNVMYCKCIYVCTYYKFRVT